MVLILFNDVVEVLLPVGKIVEFVMDAVAFVAHFVRILKHCCKVIKVVDTLMAKL